MRLLAEGATPYVRWSGTIVRTSRLWVVFEGEVQRVIKSTWGLLAVLIGMVFGLAFIGQLFDFNQQGAALSMGHFQDMLDWLLWGGLAVAAITGATTLLMDKQHGALELYFTRSLTPGEYLAGKCLAQFALSAGVILVPVLVYVLMGHVLFSEFPDGWGLAIPVGLLVAVGWGLLVSGLALGVSAVGRNAAGTVVLLAGAFVVLEVFLWRLVVGITDNAYVALISPMAGARQLTAWIMGEPLPLDVEVHYAAAVWFVLVVFGWGLLLWRRPRVRGVER